MESKPRLSLRDARRLHGANGGKGTASSSSNPNARAYRVARQTGQLNLSTRNLQEFPKEILGLHELADEVRGCSTAIVVIYIQLHDRYAVLTIWLVVSALVRLVCSAGRTQLGVRGASKSGPEVRLVRNINGSVLSGILVCFI